MSRIGSTVKATPLPGGGKRLMSAEELVAELIPAVLYLALSGRWIDVDAVKEVRPKLAATYTQRYSVVPSYLGAGRSGDGLGLHRFKGGGAYSPSFENADLALAAGRRLGWDDGQIAGVAGFPSFDALVRAVESLPDHETFRPRPPAPPAGPSVRSVAPSLAPKPPAGPTAAEQRRAAKEATEAQEKAERVAAFAASQERRREEQERLDQACQEPAVQAVLDLLTDDGE